MTAFQTLTNGGKKDSNSFLYDFAALLKKIVVKIRLSKCEWC